MGERKYPVETAESPRENVLFKIIASLVDQLGGRAEITNDHLDLLAERNVGLDIDADSEAGSVIITTVDVEEDDERE